MLCSAGSSAKDMADEEKRAQVLEKGKEHPEQSNRDAHGNSSVTW